MLSSLTTSLVLLFMVGANIGAASVPAVLVAGPAGRSLPLAAWNSLPAKVSGARLAEALGAAALAPGSQPSVLLVVTVTEGLSLADFARYGGDLYGGSGTAAGDSAFANVAALSEKLGGRHLLVSEAGGLLTALRGLAWSVPPVDIPAEGGNIGEVVSATAGPRLVMASAPDAGAADRLLGAACAALQARGLPYITVFTAVKESTAPPAAADSAAATGGRHLLAVSATPAPDAGNGTYVDCKRSVLLYFRSLQVRQLVNGVEKFTWVSIPRVENGAAIIDTANSRCDAAGGNRTLALAFNSSTGLPLPLKTLGLQLELIAKGGFWTVSSATASLECLPASTANCTSVSNAPVVAKNLADLAAPNGTCYHCTSGVTLQAGINSTLYLRFGKIQFQAFGVPIKGGFSSSVNDCVGFFSVEVWFSLLVLLVVTVILMYGVLMLVSVATPDRFDDPKGKTIQVNVQEGN